MLRGISDLNPRNLTWWSRAKKLNNICVWGKRSRFREQAAGDGASLVPFLELLQECVADGGALPSQVASEFADLIAKALAGEDPAQIHKAAARLVSQAREHSSRRSEEATAKLYMVCRELVESTEEALDCGAQVAVAAQKAARNLRYVEDSTSRDDLWTSIDIATRGLVVSVTAFERSSDAARSRSMHALEQLRQRLSDACSSSRVDPMTKLPNRRAFEGYMLSQVRGREDVEFAVGMAELVGFTEFESAAGPSKAEDLLKSTAESLKQCMEPGGFVARIGGTTFGVAFAGPAAEVDRRFQHWARNLPGIAKEFIEPVYVTISGDLCPSASTILSDLDDALLAAKKRRDQRRQSA